MPNFIRYSNFEPYPFFENELENGTLEIKISGNRSAEITASEFISFFDPGIGQPDRTLNIQNKLAYEFIVIGTTFERPRNILINRINDTDSLFVPPSLTPILNATNTMVTNLNNDFEVEREVRKREKVWYFKMHLWLASDTGGASTPQTYFNFKLFSGDYKITSQEQIEAKFLANNKANIIPQTIQNNPQFYSHPTKAIKASSIATQLFENLNPIALETHFDDLYLTNGEMIRNRTNRQSLKMKPKDFYENLNRLIPIGIGMNYSGTPELQMLTYEELYENTVFKTFNDADFISEVKVSIAENMLYNEVEVGYSEFKESNEELHRKNSYVINGGRGNGKLNLVTNWIASKYIFKKAKNQSREQEGKEFDSKIFILSIEDAYGFKITKSQNNSPTDPLFDNVLEFNGGNVLGLNRRYSSIINLINQKFRWGLSFWKSINGLSPNNETVYTKDLEYYDTYHAYLDGFPISANNTFDATLTHATQVIPKYIEFSVVMSIVEFYEIRKNWYKAIEVVGQKTYKGNIIEARYQNGVCNFKLLNRI